MKIRHITINNFRGIKHLDYDIPNDFVCFIGPGDSTKTTILDAIEYALGGRWSLPIDDGDFYNSIIDCPIEIIVSVADLPLEFFDRENKFGDYLRGWNPKDGINDEPKEGDEDIISVRLKIDRALEPVWSVINDRNDEGKRISSADRSKFYLSRLGDNIDRHFCLSRGSILTQFADAGVDLNIIITEANRNVRELTDLTEIDYFKTILSQAEYASKKLGVKPKNDLSFRLDLKSMYSGTGAISIHDDGHPFRLGGLGSRRLLVIGLQMLSLKAGAILLIDEFEYGLEPHRIKHLLSILQGVFSEKATTIGQVFLTTHSDKVAEDLSADKLFIVRSNNGITSMDQAPPSLQATIRTTPGSILARKVIVCEGKTEFGFIRALDKYWLENGREPFAFLGVVPTISNTSGGDKAPQVASDLAQLGYNTCLFVDSDKLDKLEPPIDILRSQGIAVVHWSEKLSIEEQIAKDLSWEALKKVVQLALEIKIESYIEKGQETNLANKQARGDIYGLIFCALDIPREEAKDNLDILKLTLTEKTIRQNIGMIAKKRSWFKRTDYGEKLGLIVFSDLNNLGGKELLAKIKELENFIYEH